MSKPNYKYLGHLQDALGDVCKLFEFGTKKYPNRRWDDIKDTKSFREARVQSLLRHTLQVAQEIDSVDDEHGLQHLAAVAWNALVILQLKYNMESRFKSAEDIIKDHNRIVEEVWINPDRAPYPYGRHTMPNKGEING